MKQMTAIFKTILLVTVLASVIACSGGYFSDPGHGGGGGSYNPGSTGGTGGTDSKPAKLSNGATYREALDKLDEIIEYCGTDLTLAGAKASATSTKSYITTTGSSGWSSISSSMITTINSIIAALP
jgi:hypothetical protein